MTNFAEATREALEFLRTRNDVGTVATVDDGGQPFAAPVYYVMGEEFEVYFLTTKGTHKARNIESHPKVAFSVGAGPDYIAVMIRGSASVPDAAEHTKILPQMSDKLDRLKAFKWPVRTLDDLKDQNLVLYKITPEKVTFLNINSSQEPKSATDHLYHLLD